MFTFERCVYTHVATHLRKTVIILIILTTNLIFGQVSNVKIELPELLVGMFNDYNGRQFVPDNPEKSKLVTTFYCSQRELSKLFLDSLNTLNKTLNFDVKVKNTGFIEIYSSEFSTFFNRYYKYTLDKDFGYVDENDNEYDIYFGKLNKEKFKSKNQKLSFLIGTFLRYGTFLDETKIRLDFANSPNHFRIAKKFLKKLNFKITEISVCDEIMTPCVQRITFELNNEHLYFFKKLEHIRPAIYDETDCI